MSTRTRVSLTAAVFAAAGALVGAGVGDRPPAPPQPVEARFVPTFSQTDKVGTWDCGSPPGTPTVRICRVRN